MLLAAGAHIDLDDRLREGIQQALIFGHERVVEMVLARATSLGYDPDDFYERMIKSPEKEAYSKRAVNSFDLSSHEFATSDYGFIADF